MERAVICGICGHSGGHQAFRAREMMYGLRDEFAYFQCPNCECLQIEEIPADLSRYYNNYHAFYQGFADRHSRRSGLRSLPSHLRDQYALFGKGLIGRLLYRRSPRLRYRTLGLAGLARDWRVLDVGSGSGILLNTLRDFGVENVLGVDPYIPEEIRYPNGVVIRKQELDEVEGEWDLVIFQHSFEHVPNPLATLRKAAGLLSPRGVCLLRMPTVSSYAWEHYREHWVQLDAPRHLFIHSAESVRVLAEQAGLQLTRTVYESYGFQFWGSEQYMNDIPLRSDQSYLVNPAESMFSPVEIQRFDEKAQQLNHIGRGDEAAFLLTRADGNGQQDFSRESRVASEGWAGH